MATVTIGATDYPSFASVAAADDLLAADIARSTGWALRNTDLKGRALATATRTLQQLGWCGTPPTIDAPPAAVVLATSMLAADFAARPKLAANPSGALPSGIRRARAGPAEVEFSYPGATTAPRTPLPADIWAVLTAAGLVGCVVDTGNDGPFISGISDDCCIAPGAYDRNRLGWDCD